VDETEIYNILNKVEEGYGYGFGYKTLNEKGKVTEITNDKGKGKEITNDKGKGKEITTDISNENPKDSLETCCSSNSSSSCSYPYLQYSSRSYPATPTNSRASSCEYLDVNKEPYNNTTGDVLPKPKSSLDSREILPEPKTYDLITDSSNGNGSGVAGFLSKFIEN